MPFAAPPLSALLTNSMVLEPWLLAVESQGPWMFLLAIVSTALPSLSSTIRQPYFAVAVLPFVVGRVPPTTTPPRRMFNGRVSPTPPGHGPGSVLAFTVANREVFPAGLICTIVVPVP